MTTLIVLVAIVVYSIPASYLWRRWSWEFAQDAFNSRNEAMCFGLMQAVVWPVVIVWKTLARSNAFMLAPPDVRQREREAELEEKVRHLERELELHDPPTNRL